MAIIFAFLSFVSTALGGIIGIRFRDNLHLLLAFTAGVLLSLISFELLPEIIENSQSSGLPLEFAMFAFITGFLVFHILEKFFLIHTEHHETYTDHKHPALGVFSATALAVHSFLDGVGIGLGFQISSTAGIIIAIAVIAHDFSDGINTASLMLINKNTLNKTKIFIIIDAIAPILGALSTLLFSISSNFLAIYLGFFAGFLLYISTGEILPEAHSKNSSYKTILMTLLGVLLIFVVTRFS